MAPHHACLWSSFFWFVVCFAHCTRLDLCHTNLRPGDVFFGFVFYESFGQVSI